MIKENLFFDKNKFKPMDKPYFKLHFYTDNSESENYYFKFLDKKFNYIFEDTRYNFIYHFNSDGKIHNQDGLAYIEKNKRFNMFYLNGVGLSRIEFANLTKHKICLVCLDFCNQECFN